MAEPLDPARAALFLNAQTPAWPAVTAELRSGRKRSHWMWFVFPQLRSLGRSPTSRRFGLADLDEAAAYLADPRLRDRLEEATGLMLAHKGTGPDDILGTVDALKLRSSMTLFSLCPNAGPLYRSTLDAFYASPCPLTLAACS